MLKLKIVEMRTYDESNPPEWLIASERNKQKYKYPGIIKLYGE